VTPAGLAALHRACFSTPRPWSEAEFADLLADKNVILCSRPGGFALGRMTGPEAELLTLAVHPEKRRKGIGYALMQSFEKKAFKRGVTEIFLEVAEDNPAAIALYFARGFQSAGIRKDYYFRSSGKKISALVLKKTCDPKKRNAK
jgi:[ribosomal protein S18]-alanine N-acetyltransferase